MASDKAIEYEVAAFSNTAISEIDFTSTALRWYLKTDADVRIAFDRPANSGDFLLEADDRVVEIVGQATKVYAIGNSGSGNLYIWATR